MKNEEQQKAPEGEKELAKEIQEKAFKGGQNAVSAYQSNLKAPEAPKVELPKGGGALRSIGEKFEANPVTGTANISVPIAISPGRNGFQPELSLSYSSGGGNGIFGMGWGVGLGSISRKTQKRLPQYDDANESDVFIFAGAEDLVPVPTSENGTYKNETETHNIQLYKPRTEKAFFKIERWTAIADGDTHWRVTDKGNVTSILGESAGARIFDSEDPSKIFEWKIERKYDALGNAMVFEYLRENNTNLTAEPADYNRLKNGTAFNQIYPRRIKYGNTVMYGAPNWASNSWHFEVIFNYGEDDGVYPVDDENLNWTRRMDPFSSFRSGFDIRTYRLCHKVLMYHHFSGLNGGNPLLVKCTEINYDENKVGSQIQSVQHKGYDETDEKAIPPVSFMYSKATPNTKIYSLKESDTANLPEGIDGQNYIFADPKGEGINGILTESADAWYFKPNEGHDNFYIDHPSNYSTEPIGSFGKLESLREKPNGATHATLQDIDGDGVVEAVIRDAQMAGYYKQEENGEWGEFQYFDGHPNLDFQSEDIKFVDLNGDGRADILITEQDQLKWIAYQDSDVFAKEDERKVKPGYGNQTSLSRVLDEEQGPRVVFSNGQQNIFLSDMTGDGFSDLVRIENGSITYWPHKGYGQFGAKVVMENVPQFDYVDRFNANRIRLGDIDGSGTTDILYLGTEQTMYFINQAGNSLASGVELAYFPTKDDVQNVQLADILGNGTSCLVWSSPHEADKPTHIKYMDLMGGQKPYLLEEMDNGMGALRKFSYAPSTKFYLRDKKAGNPWVTKLSFPVQTLERVEVFEQITQSRFVSRYAYHHGYFDPVEREFRGFGMVEQWDTELYEDFNEAALYQVGSNALNEASHSEPVYTKSWFHNGYFEQSNRIETQYVSEYWDGDAASFSIQENELPENLSADELREAHRALKGSLLRQEVYGLDQEGDKGIPYSVTENRYAVAQLQEKAANYSAVYRTEVRESFSYSYEQDSNDPRIVQQLLLKSDVYGNPLKVASIAYPRRGTGHEPEQLQGYAVYQENSFINHHPVPVSDKMMDNNYRLGAGSQEKVWEYRPAVFGSPITIDSLLNDIDTATVIKVDEDFTGTTNEKRLMTKARIYYYSEDLSSTLTLGNMATHALPHHTEQLAFTDELIDEIYNNDGTSRIDLAGSGQSTLIEAGYVQDGSEWWIPSGHLIFDEEHFYLTKNSVDIFGNSSSITYDSDKLLPIEVVDPLGNIVKSTNNYVHLQPTLITDPNGNRQQVELDALGMPTKVVMMGKDSSDPNYSVDEGDTLAAPNQLYEYDLFQFINYQKPNYTKLTQRETHIHDTASNNETRSSTTFFNGLSKTIQVRSQFGEWTGTNGEDTKVLVSGHQVVNNKDLVVEQFEPYFDTGFDYNNPLLESDTEVWGALVDQFIADNGMESLEDEVLFPAYMNAATALNRTHQEWIDKLVEAQVYLNLPKFEYLKYVNYSQIPEYELGTSNFTFEAWIYPTYDGPGARTIFTNENVPGDGSQAGIHLYMHDNKLSLFITEGRNITNGKYMNLRTGGLFDAHKWYHIVITKKGAVTGDLSMYVDGVNINQPNGGNGLIDGNVSYNGNADFRIGKRFSTGNENFIGYILNATVYNRALSDTEISESFANGILEPKSDSNLIMHSTLLDLETENIATDLSTLQNDGQLMGNSFDFTPVYFPDWQKLYALNNPEIELQRIRMMYDVLGRNIRTDYADGTFEKVEFDAWQQQNYDRIDTVVDSQWYVDRNSPNPSDPEPTDKEERAAWLSAKHYNTPQVIELDTLGKVFRSRDDIGSYNGTTTTHTYYDIRVETTLEGKQLKVTNALGQDTVYSYNLMAVDEEGNGVICYTDSPDGGWRRLLIDAVGNPLMAWDERGHSSRNEYDELLRPTKTFVDEGSGEQLVSYSVYGDAIDLGEAPEEKNLRGQLVRFFDQSGVSKSTSIDFKGNPLVTKKGLAFEYKNTIDWTDVASESTIEDIDNLANTLYLELDENQEAIYYDNVVVYDGMNRPTLIKQPDGSQHKPSYDKASMLTKMEVKLAHEEEFTEYVSSILYNARGQRTDIYYGNSSKTSYQYNQHTFRLERLLTTRNTGQDILQDLNYTFDAEGNIVEQVDDAQQTHYFSNTVIEPKAKYQYDALYRLVQASGREKVGLSAPTHAMYTPDSLPTNEPSGTNLSTYCEEYTYDELGNVLILRHRDTCGGVENWTRHYVYNAGTTDNYLQAVYTGATPPPSPQFTYDRHGNMQEMPHINEMQWDFQDQLKATTKNEETTYYVYSGGQRIRKIVEDSGGGEPLVKYERTYLGAYELYKKYEGTDLFLERTTHHVMDHRKMIALLEVKTRDEGNLIDPAEQTTITRYQYGNHLGSASLELNEDAEVLSYEEFHPFGSTSYSMHTNDAEVSLKRYKYSAKERDDETGMDYYGARYYASWLCRFISVDPRKDSFPFQSTFAYASNSPITMTDMNGEYAVKDPEKEKEGFGSKLWDSFVGEISERVDAALDPLKFSAGVAVGVGEGISDLQGIGDSITALKDLLKRASVYGYIKDSMNDETTIYEEAHAGLTALAEILSTPKGVLTLIDGINEAIDEIVDTATFENGAYEAGKFYGKVAFNVILTIASGGSAGAARLVAAIKEGPKAVARLLANTMRSKLDDATAIATKKFWTKSTKFDGVKVFQRDDIFDPTTISSWKVNGKTVTGTNVERMADGLAPIGVDGKSVNLHHMIQIDGAGMAEMTQTFHKANHGIIHINPNTIPSGINRSKFNIWRSDYWKQRANDFN